MPLVHNLYAGRRMYMEMHLRRLKFVFIGRRWVAGRIGVDVAQSLHGGLNCSRTSPDLDRDLPSRCIACPAHVSCDPGAFGKTT